MVDELPDIHLLRPVEIYHHINPRDRIYAYSQPFEPFVESREKMNEKYWFAVIGCLISSWNGGFLSGRDYWSGRDQSTNYTPR